MAEKRNLLAFCLYLKAGFDRLVIGYTLRIHTFCNSDNFLWHNYLLFLHDFEVADDVDCCIWCQ